MGACIPSCKLVLGLSMIFGRGLHSVEMPMRMKGLERTCRRGSELLGRASEDMGEGLKMADDMV